MTLNGKYFDRQAEAYFGRNGMIKVTGGHSPTIAEVKMEKNVKRTPEYMKLLHSIESCKDATQLKTLSESVIAYHKAKKDASSELLAEYVNKEDSLNVE